MTTATLLTLVVTILSLDQGVATVDKGRLAGLRLGDSGRIYYQLKVGAETKKIDVGGGTLIEVEDSRSRLRIDGDAALRPGYLVEFEIPLTAASGSGRETAGIDPAVRSWIERLLPGNREAQAEVLRLIRERRIRRSKPAGSVPDREAELLARVEELETTLETRSRDDELRDQLRQRQAARLRAEEALGLQADLTEARADVARLTQRLEQAEAARRSLEAERPPEAVPALPPADPGLSPDAEVLAAVRSWATAWSEQRVDDYLSFYGRGFRPPQGRSRSEWEAYRRPRVLGPSYIEVALEDLEILSVDSGKAAVKFRQLYRSDTFNVSTAKALELVREEGQWKIVAETIR